MPTTNAILTPAVSRIPTAEEHLEAAFNTHGYQQEAMVAEYQRIRNKAISEFEEEVDDPDALLDVREFLSKDESRRKAAMKLANDANAPIVSRETQVAFFKQLIQDFMRNKKRPGLSALTALKAGELLNKMCGYDAPVEQKITHEHKVSTLPVIQQPFKGELPPLKVMDIGNDDGTITSVAHGIEPETEIDSDLNIF